MTPTSSTPRQSGSKQVVVTGGCGFIGSNVVNRLAASGQRVLVLDNLSRPGVRVNLEWLAAVHPTLVDFEIGDIRDEVLVHKVIRHASHVYRFAAQVAVTTSLDNPVEDFEVNARGTLNVLEAVRNASHSPSILFTSTNKVYGDLPDLELADTGTRYEPLREQIRLHGIDEHRPISFHSPYGCSKGAADQYVLDYARCYRIPAVVFRMSCIYGQRQFGTEDQGWVAHFLIRALAGEPITIYGDGRQVRDVLYVDDLVDAMRLAVRNIERTSGQAFNIGGGAEFSVSLREVLDRIGKTTGRSLKLQFDDWRTGDQRYYVSDTRRFRQETGWAPSIDPAEGVARLWKWLATDRKAQAADLRQPPAVALAATEARV